MMVELSDIVSELESWSAGKSLVLHSPGDVFCSGADLQMVKQLSSSSEGLEMATIMHDVLTRLHNLPLTSVALLKGKAIGGGAELVTACDFRLLTPNASIQFVQTKMGVVTGWGGGTRLCHLLNTSVALHLLISGITIPAEECLRIGLATDLIPGNRPLDEAKDWLKNHVIGSSEVVQAMKNVVICSRKLQLEQSFLEERKLFASVWGGEAQIAVLKKNVKH